MKKTNKNTSLTPEQYIRQKARTLPLGQCYMNKDWFISGMAVAVVTRCHKMGTYTFAVFQFDTFCSGLIDCKVEFSRDKASFDNFLGYLKEEFKIEPVTYQEAHNLVYGAIAFGEDAGFSPSPMFNLAKFVLEEDTEDVPLINYQFGRFGKHFLLADNEQELDEFMPHLIAHLGKENILFSIEGSDRYYNGEDFYDSETRKVLRQIAKKIRHQEDMPTEPYSYEHPAYPTQLKLKHERVRELLYDPDNRLNLSDAQIDELLALPHDELKNDLEEVLRYEMGRTCDEIPATDEKAINSAFVHALILLKQLADPTSLSVVLETLCQRKEFYDYQLGIIFNETYVPTLYNIGKDQLDQFFAFLQIPGLYTYARYLIFPTVLQIAIKEPERRNEVIEWFRKVLRFYTENLNTNHCCDGLLAGLLVADLVKLQAEELLPEIKAMYETGKVNEQCCGNYENVKTIISKPSQFAIEYQFEAHAHYEQLRLNREQFITAHNQLLAELMKIKDEKDQTATKEVKTTPTTKSTKAKTAETTKPAKATTKKETASKTKGTKTEGKPAGSKKTTSKSTAKNTAAKSTVSKTKKAATTKTTGITADDGIEKKKPRTTKANSDKTKSATAKKSSTIKKAASE